MDFFLSNVLWGWSGQPQVQFQENGKGFPTIRRREKKGRDDSRRYVPQYVHIPQSLRNIMRGRRDVEALKMAPP